MTEKDILYEEGDFWISFEKNKNCFIIWEIGITHSKAVGYVGKTLGLEFAIDRLKSLLPKS